MTITAKFSGKCSVCGGAISVGARVEWTKGEGARHTTCAGAKATSAAAPRTGRRTARAGTTYERGMGLTCDECGERAVRGTRCWETGMMH